jgi:peptidyl-prolyl cis-trans isomerase B (cyclophilin B)
VASSKREKELARQRAERQAARRAAAAQRARQRRAVVASVLAVLLLVGGVAAAAITMGGDDEPAPDLATQQTASPAASESGSGPKKDAQGNLVCEFVKGDTPSVRKVELPPPTGVETEGVFDVTIATNQGNIVFETLTSKAPCTIQNLRSLAHFAYFDDTPCHRLTTEGISVLQCGSPDGSPNGGPGYSFADEGLEGAQYPRGTVAMANSGPATNGSQFFLVYEDSALPPNYTPFGKITSGLDVLEKVAAAGSDESAGTGDGKPNLPVQIKTLRVKPRAA